MAKKQTFLQLAPEFGGTKFGPFQGAEIRLGSDPTRNDIVLPEGLGVVSEHARLIKQQDDSFLLSPTDRTAAVYLWRADGRPPKPVQSPVAVIAGDGFSVVTPEGPRFIIVLELPKQQAADPKAKDSFGKAKDKLGKASFAEEIKRQGLARALATGAGQGLSNAWTFISSGAIFQPRYILLGLAIVGGWVFAGGIGCTAVGLGSMLNSKNQELTDVKGDLSACQGSKDGGGDPTIMDEATKILKDKDWDQTLNEDSELRQAYIQKLEYIFKNPDQYDWVWKRKGENNPFIAFRARLEAGKVPDNVVRVIAYAAANPGYNKENKFKVVVDSEGQEVCARGPLQMTWRQAHNLELDQVQFNALIDARAAAQGDIAGFKEKLLTDAPADAAIEDGQIDRAGVTMQDGRVCIFTGDQTTDDDDRDDPTKLAKDLISKLGSKAKKVPAEGENRYIAARVALFYASDFKAGFDNLSFEDGSISTLLNSPDITPQRKQYTLDRTAEVLARATALPCIAALDKSPAAQSPPEAISKDFDTAKLVPCGVLRLLVDSQSQ